MTPKIPINDFIGKAISKSDARIFSDNHIYEYEHILGYAYQDDNSYYHMTMRVGNTKMAALDFDHGLGMETFYICD